MATLINGNGNPAVYASQDADWFGALTGNQTVIMNVNQNLAYELLDNNTLLIKSGVLVTKEGRRVQIDVGDTEEIIIPTGTQNVNRFYICGFKLETDGEGVQTATTFIEQMGSSTETITEETFKDGANTIYVSLYRIYQQGITISSITPLKDTVSIPTTKAFDIKDWIDIIHPVGKIIMTDDSRNPAEYYPGTTWIAWGSGRVPVGVDVNDSDFNAPNKTGGAKSHNYTPAGSNSGGVVQGTALTVEQMPSHNHGSRTLKGKMSFRRYGTDATGSDILLETSGIINKGVEDWSGSHGIINVNGHSVTNPYKDFAEIVATHTHDSNGGGQAHGHGFIQPTFTGTASTQSHLQPYITCYMWKRTA
jgi:hypothetical protein